ncbi:ASCH domain-containing protein [Azohydromonas lata]|uniref:ASCH domain-containing protein n=1 Tax=Azohydromonas lata TaxID=45677 RepID=A0ABU5ICZ3_9BURK|nr:ASCH domain-containing protein [Azohydromonas lata]MDZ5456985.1 ASCH domain-containing protein [Azohydromonas lata]
MKILLSIKPEYAYRILDGSKRFEFRRRVHRDARVKTVVIYATMPVGKVIGEFTIQRVHAEHPEQLWKMTKDFSGITENFFAEYFHGRDVGYAIEVKSVKRFKNPKKLNEYLPSGVAPQSYAYVPQ